MDGAAAGVERRRKYKGVGRSKCLRFPRAREEGRKREAIQINVYIKCYITDYISFIVH